VTGDVNMTQIPSVWHSGGIADLRMFCLLFWKAVTTFTYHFLVDYDLEDSGAYSALFIYIVVLRGGSLFWCDC
jgi:hypothetical protein